MNEKGYNWAPKFINSNDQSSTIEMEYAGNPINRNNAPKDWKEQFQIILNDLKQENIQHNDIKPGELLVKDSKLFLVDYGWACLNGDWGCGQGFNASKKPSHSIHDKDAMGRISRHLK